ncbi:MAG: hypothetical protein V3U96_07170 [Paracoccaceae bacterium]
MDLQLNKEIRSKLYLATLEALGGCEDHGTAEAFADIVSFGNGGSTVLAEVFSLTEAVANLVYENSGDSGKYLQISLDNLASCVGSKKTASAALRLNGFNPYKNSDAWTNSPNGGRGFVVSIGADFFANHLQDWAKVA